MGNRKEFIKTFLRNFAKTVRMERPSGLLNEAEPALSEDNLPEVRSSDRVLNWQIIMIFIWERVDQSRISIVCKCLRRTDPSLLPVTLK